MNREKAIGLKPCPFCGKEQKQVTEVVEVLLTIVKYQEDALFLSNFILGDWQDLPLEVKQLIKKLKLKVWNKRAALEKPAEAGEFTKAKREKLFCQGKPQSWSVDEWIKECKSALAEIDYLEDVIKRHNEMSKVDAERLARLFHETYEELAPQFGYETREASRKPWEDVPERNKKLMIAVAENILLIMKKQTAEDCIEDCAIVDDNRYLREDVAALKNELQALQE